jgi:phospholipid/cholesterol/gamma-HCH transport system permease protein
MNDKSLHSDDTPYIIYPEEYAGELIMLKGDWTLRKLAESIKLRKIIKKLGANKEKKWDISQIERLDSAAAFLLWEAWGKQLPSDLNMRKEHRRLFERWHERKVPEPQVMLADISIVWNFWRTSLQGFYQHICAWLTLFGRLILDMFFLFTHPHAIPLKEISLTIYKAGVSALGITALVGLLVGVSMSYLSSLQLQRFGAEIYIIDLLGLSIIRELGPMLGCRN